MAAGAVVVGAGPILTACGSSAKTKNEQAANAAVKLPTYVPYQGVTPDFPAQPAGALAGYLRYPAKPTKATSGTPGSGGTVTAFTDLFNPVPPSVGQNKYWQTLNSRLGVNLNLNMVSDTDFSTKFATLMAGGSLPDLVQIPPGGAPQLPALLAAKFQELTEFLGADAVKKYPFLANVPTYSWRSTVYNGGIFGLPLARPLMGAAFYQRQDLIDAKGLNGEVHSFADLMALCKNLTDPKANRYANGDPVISMLTFVREMVGIPNDWAQHNGKFTSAYATDEMRKALDSVRSMVKAGVFHPDSFSSTTVSRKTWFTGGITAMNDDNSLNWITYATDPSAPELKLNAMIAPGFDGGNGTHRAGSPTFGIVALKKADKSRIEELLRIANWLAAPYGTEEYLLRKFGVAGVDYTMQNGNPVLTSRGSNETNLPVVYVMDSPYVLGPGPKSIVQPWHDFQTAALRIVVEDPTVGLYSDTQSLVGAQLSTNITDAITQYLQGRSSLSDWNDAVRQWRSKGGDKIRAEYEKAYQTGH
jgi:putative aldouronate transport system substrate-binding protein